ncbi:hypothetical protein [Nocardioides marmotae]|uniref:Uncharacterized protein n=1 Tax=Nocardioides marmotae TaxID=2663857 RepID=A0A6I3JF15_9ACTN|nr:hypothetical protein [Nocardioides marmotae]MCR6033035.1 hypothetical protein [Gordonia jinghuaiqii]MBC9732534.1 hypothetical protein [Nocardioides marmotae]MTB83653.1 hypothetical protein [Nocardioides marmotae]MTB96687.1 hypothetical protein [Nocardioides marmotae]QKE03098.1 hypothetical protein HPC71_20065 [Nocardioides marmotae]
MSSFMSPTTRRSMAAATAVGAAALVLATPGAAHAATSTFTDKAGDIGPGVDLLSVKVVNGETNLRVVTTHRDLVPSYRSAAGGAVYLDTDLDSKGPEHALVGGYFDGTDYALVEVDGWGDRDGERVECDYASRLDYDAETVRSRFSQDCFAGDDAADDSTDVRVEVRVSGAKKDGGTAVDWLGTPRTFSKAVARG